MFTFAFSQATLGERQGVKENKNLIRNVSVTPVTLRQPGAIPMQPIMHGRLDSVHEKIKLYIACNFLLNESRSPMSAGKIANVNTGIQGIII